MKLRPTLLQHRLPTSVHLGLLISLVYGATACGGEEPEEDDHAHHAASEEATNRLDLPAAVRSNLGVTFATAQERVVQRTLRLPGRFVLSSTATRVHVAPLAGVVELHVELVTRVRAGDLLATVKAPSLRERQHELHKVEHGIRRAVERHGVVVSELAALKSRLAFLQRRVKQLGAAGVRRAGIEGQILAARSQVPAATAQVAAARAEIVRERHHKRILLLSLAEVTGLSVDELQAEVSPSQRDHAGAHRWDSLVALQVRAKRAGVVTSLGAAAGGWATRGQPLVEVTDDRSLRFVATALQADLPRFVDGTAANVSMGLSPKNVAREAFIGVTGKVRVGVAGSDRSHTVPIAVELPATPTWAVAGMVGVADVVVAGTSRAEIAIPSVAVVRDGLHDVFFRRDPADPDKVIRVAAELGANDGRWVAVLSDVNVGDEVVVAGAYELKLAAAQQPTAKGHFHADGSFHAAEEH